MGGVGSGGRRPGSGRKPKDAIRRALDGGRASHGGARPPATVVAHPSAAGLEWQALPAVDVAAVPEDLTPEAAAVWHELAPFALEARTLTPATALGFRMLCTNVALVRQYAGSVRDRGGANHRGLIQRIDAELLRFNLAPCGKPIAPAVEAAAPVDPLRARYFPKKGPWQ